MINPQPALYSMVKALPVTTETRKGYPLTPLLFNPVIDFLRRVIHLTPKKWAKASALNPGCTLESSGEGFKILRARPSSDQAHPTLWEWVPVISGF